MVIYVFKSVCHICENEKMPSLFDDFDKFTFSMTLPGLDVILPISMGFLDMC